MKQAFVVLAGTGEYSDRAEWPIRVVMTEARAQELVSELDAEVAPLWEKVQTAKKSGRRKYGTWTYNEYDARREQFKEGWSKIEPSLGEPDYTGFCFSYEPVKLED